MQTNLKKLSDVKQSEKEGQIMIFKTLCNIHLSNMILKYADGAILGGFAKGKNLRQVEEFMYEQIEAIRPQLLSILETTEFPEQALKSLIGPKDGNMYESLFTASANNPLNENPVLDCVSEHVKPMSKRLLAKM